MPLARTIVLPTIVAACALLGGQAAAVDEEYRVFDGAEPAICQSGAKSDWMTIDGPDQVNVARADGDRLNVAVCVSDDVDSALHLQWKADGYWNSSGTLSHGCAEILGTSKVKLRPVNSNFHEVATYYTCVQE